MFHIKITDLKTGEVEIDTDATCIIICRVLGIPPSEIPRYWPEGGGR